MWKKVNNYELDSNQQKIVLDESNYLLVVAGAGSGKTLTILGKIKYLIEEKNIRPSEILSISFTNKASTSLKEKIYDELHIDMPVYTFHKLGLEILKNKNYEIASSNLLEDIIHLFFYETILSYPKLINIVLKYFDYKNSYKQLIVDKEKEIISLEKLLTTFIKLFKCNNYNIEDYRLFFKKIRFSFTYKKEKIFLLLSLNILLLYNSYLKENNEIDFDDMIILATKEVKENFNKNIKYIIIDEYQDTSLIRFNLIKEIIDKTGSRLMVVGDDYQSIYRFTGCDINLFLDFKKYFNDSKILKIENTYRNSRELINVAGSFIMKNYKQIPKKLKSNKRLDKPIGIIYYTSIKKGIKKLIESINTPILILGRNNKDINLILDDDFKLDGDTLIYKKKPNIKITYLTIHKSKGLECDNVIIINLYNNILGIPSKIKEDKILRLVTKKERYPYSEERRLFYVALTRTKNRVYLFTPVRNESIFIKEIKKYKRFVFIKKI